VKDKPKEKAPTTAKKEVAAKKAPAPKAKPKKAAAPKKAPKEEVKKEVKNVEAVPVKKSTPA
jgi:hypothetical protein